MDTTFSATNLTLATFALLVLRIILKATVPRRGRQVPPGPRSLPLLGNVRQLPKAYQERTFLEWGREYGPIVFAKMFQTPVVIINSLEVARDLLNERSQNYSGRPVFTMLTELYVPQSLDFDWIDTWAQIGLGGPSSLASLRNSLEDAKKMDTRICFEIVPHKVSLSPAQEVLYSLVGHRIISRDVRRPLCLVRSIHSWYRSWSYGRLTAGAGTVLQQS